MQTNDSVSAFKGRKIPSVSMCVGRDLCTPAFSTPTPEHRSLKFISGNNSFVFFFYGKVGDAQHVQEFTALHWFQNSAPSIPDCISVHVSRWMQPFLFSHLKQLGNNPRAATRVGASLSNHSLWWQHWFISTMYGCPQMPAGLCFLFWTCKGKQIRPNWNKSGS